MKSASAAEVETRCDPSAPQVEVACAGKVAQVAYDGPEAISARLEELDREWTRGQAIAMITGFGILVGLGLAFSTEIWWFLLPIALGLILLQHALSRRSLLAFCFRWLGLRSSREIQIERTTLKALRGDFRNLPTIMDKDDSAALDRLEGEGGIVSGTPPPAAGNKAVIHQVLETIQH